LDCFEFAIVLVRQGSADRAGSRAILAATIEQLFGLGPLTNRDAGGVAGLQNLATLATPRNVTTAIPDAQAAAQPREPVPGTPAQSTVTTAVPPVGPTLHKTPPATPLAPRVMASPPTAPEQSRATLDLSDPWLASALAVAIKAHIEAVPADATKIKARGFGVKTVGDLAHYCQEIAPIVQTARVAARTRKVAARRQRASQTTAGTGVHQVITAHPIGTVS
jgi:hypothetical protein